MNLFIMFQTCSMLSALAQAERHVQQITKVTAEDSWWKTIPRRFIKMRSPGKKPIHPHCNPLHAVANVVSTKNHPALKSSPHWPELPHCTRQACFSLAGRPFRSVRMGPDRVLPKGRCVSYMFHRTLAKWNLAWNSLSAFGFAHVHNHWYVQCLRHFSALKPR